MQLGDILDDLSLDVATGGLEITHVDIDSRDCVPGSLFFALPGSSTNGVNFADDAVRRGALCVVASTRVDVAAPVVLVPATQLTALCAHASAAVVGHPESKTRLVAVTGTNGKTSTAEFLRQIWAQAGHQAASLGTLGLIAPGMEPGPGLTTPDPVALADTLARLARAGIARAAIEASSHGLDQFRLDGVRLEAGAFTNLTRDHLDYHGSLPAYRAAKLRLFAELLPAGAPAFATTALDPETSTALAAIAAERRLRLGFVGEGGTAIALLRATPGPDGQDLDLRMDGASHTVHLPLPGRFQADNALLAAALAHALGDAQALDRLPRLAGVRGRMERAAVLANGATVYVDYAHTPDALERLLTALRPHTKGLLHVVFGAGGDRDRGKRPLMGAAAARHADRIITDDNPRTEDPAAIRAAVLAACPGAAEIGDRAAAIEAGLNALGPGDVLAVAGKGHEQGQTVGTITLPFDDVTVVRRLTGTA